MFRSPAKLVSASAAAWAVQFNMRLLSLHIYASQVCTETALTCRDEIRPGHSERLSAQPSAGKPAPGGPHRLCLGGSDVARPAAWRAGARTWLIWRRSQSNRDGVVRRTRMVVLLYYGPVCVPETADLDAAPRKHKSACIKHVPACSVHMSARCVAPAVIDSQGDHDGTWESTGRRSPAGLLPECRAVAEHDHRPRTRPHAAAT